MKFYVFHVKNPNEVQFQGAKPIVEEKGPYAYKEIREKVSISKESEGRDKIRHESF